MSSGPPPTDRVLVERGDELAVLGGLVETVAASQGGAVVIEGIAGIGKTELLRSVAARAVARGFTILDARGSGLEQGFTFGVVRQLLERAVQAIPPPDRARILGGSAEPAARVLLEQPGADEPGPSDAGFGVLHGLYWTVANLAQDSPHLLVVDDLQWADDASQRFAAFVARRLAGLPIGLVAAVRTGEGVLAAPVLDLEHQPDVSVLRPAALSVDGVRHLVEHGLGPADREFVAACSTVTGGIPFYVRELVVELERDRVAPTSTNTPRIAAIQPESVARSVVIRIAHLPGDTVAVAQALAVLGDGTSEAIVADLARVDRGAAEAALHGMRSAGVLAADQLGYAHPIMRAAIYADVPEATRAAGHARAARLLWESGHGVERVSAHLLRAPAGTCAWGVDVLRAAARAALDRGGAAEAVTFLERGLAESTTPDTRAELTLDLGKAAWHAGAPDALTHLERVAEGARDAPWWPEAVLFFARALMVAGRLDDAARLIEETTDRLAEISPEIAVRMTVAFALAARPSRELHGTAIERLPDLQSRVGGLDTPMGRLLRGVVAGDALLRNEPAVIVADHARRAWGAGDVLTLEPPGSFLHWPVLHALICADDFDGADVALQLLLAESRRRGSATGFAMARVLRAMLDVRRGSLLEAEADASEGLMLAREHFALGFPTAVGLAAEALVERGELDKAADVLVTNEIPSDLVTSGVDAVCRGARGLLHLRHREWPAARDELLTAGANLMSWESSAPTLLPWRSRAAVACARLGDETEAGRLAHEELELAEDFGSPHTTGVALQAVGQISRGDERRDALDRAVELLEGTPFELEAARAHVALGMDLRHTGDTTAARARLRQGLDLATRCHATPLAERARRELIATGARPRRAVVTGVDALTATERRVCGLAASGLTNRDIAEELFVTVKTVEVHLTNSYRKLGITARGQLAASLDHAPRG